MQMGDSLTAPVCDMLFKHFVELCIMFASYLCLGAYMFYSLERPLEEERRLMAKAEAIEIRGTVDTG